VKDNVKTQLYLDRSKKISLTNLHRQKLEIFRCLVIRKHELDSLHRSSVHGFPSIFT
jgi:hypothetical protein